MMNAKKVLQLKLEPLLFLETLQMIDFLLYAFVRIPTTQTGIQGNDVEQQIALVSEAFHVVQTFIRRRTLEHGTVGVDERELILSGLVHVIEDVGQV